MTLNKKEIKTNITSECVWDPKIVVVVERSTKTRRTKTPLAYVVCCLGEGQTLLSSPVPTMMADGRSGNGRDREREKRRWGK